MNRFSSWALKLPLPREENSLMHGWKKSLPTTRTPTATAWRLRVWWLTTSKIWCARETSMAGRLLTLKRDMYPRPALKCMTPWRRSLTTRATWQNHIQNFRCFVPRPWMKLSNTSATKDILLFKYGQPTCQPVSNGIIIPIVSIVVMPSIVLSKEWVDRPTSRLRFFISCFMDTFSGQQQLRRRWPSLERSLSFSTCTKRWWGGRSRFAAKVPHHFAKFISLFEKNKDAWTEYLMDKGEGNPPVEYLVAFEEGLRNYADCVHSLGTRPLWSKQAWRNVAKWRKREAYIALARYLLRADSGYKQWDCFRFADFTMRVTMGLTFENRHYRLSDGEDDKNFGKGNMNFDWKKHSYVPTKRVKSEPGEYKAKNVVDTSATDETPMIYDVELGKLVPLE